jgi:hypothetical protein
LHYSLCSHGYALSSGSGRAGWSAGEEGQECRRGLLARDNQGAGLDYNQFSGRDKRTSTSAAPGYEGYALTQTSPATLSRVQRALITVG